MSETTPVTIEVTIKGAIAQFNQIVPKEMAALAVEEYIKAEVAKVEHLVIADMNDKEGYEKVKRARLDLGRGIRVPIEKKGKELRADAVAYQKAVIAEESRLVDIVTPAEKKLKQMEDEYERLWEEKRLRDEAEQKAKVDSRIQALTELGMRFDAATSFYYLPEGAATIGTGHIQTWDDAQFTDFTTKVAADIERKRKEEEAAAEALQRFNERKAALTERGFKLNEAKNEMELYLDWNGETGGVSFLSKPGLNWLETIDDMEFNDFLEEVDEAIATKKAAEAAEQKRKDDELAEARRIAKEAKIEIAGVRIARLNELALKYGNTFVDALFGFFQNQSGVGEEGSEFVFRYDDGKEYTSLNISGFTATEFETFVRAAVAEAEVALAQVPEVPYKEEPLIIHEDESLNVGPEYDQAEEILTAEDEKQSEYRSNTMKVKEKLRITNIATPEVLSFFRTIGSVYQKADIEALHLPQALLIEDGEVYLLTDEETADVVSTKYFAE